MGLTTFMLILNGVPGIYFNSIHTKGVHNDLTLISKHHQVPYAKS